MKTDIRIISQYETLTQFHSGVTDEEAALIASMLESGANICIVTDNKDATRIIRWELYLSTNTAGQLMGVSERDYESAKARNFKPRD